MLAEELFAAKVHLVILDPMGVLIPIFGGRHADAPLEPDAGTLMADLVVEERLSMILDMSGFQSRTQERNFAAGFFDRLYRRNQDLMSGAGAQTRSGAARTEVQPGHRQFSRGSRKGGDHRRVP